MFVKLTVQRETAAAGRDALRKLFICFVSSTTLWSGSISAESRGDAETILNEVRSPWPSQVLITACPSWKVNRTLTPG
ncbi:hypothetical protein D3C72_2384900 [compost metagenome]